MRVCLFGHNGKVGSIIKEKLQEKGYMLVLIEKNTKIEPALIKNCNYAIDFSTPDATIENIKLCNSLKVPILVCSTGQTEKQIKKIEKMELNIPVVLCQNTSLGIGLIKNFIKTLDNQLITGAHIHESHNKSKKDLPSGTAIMLKNILQNKNICCSISSERTNHAISSHTLKLYLENEVVCFSHHALSKEVFADGAIIMAEGLKNLAPKFYKNYVLAGNYEED